jgi:flagellar hook-basal body complex protein FliE
LRNEIQRLSDLQSDATLAVKDLAAGRRSDIEGVMRATQQADQAGQMLLQLRGAALTAYDEIRQIRV